MNETEWKKSFDKWFRICKDLGLLIRKVRPVSLDLWLEMQRAESLEGWFGDRALGSCSYCQQFGRDFFDLDDEVWETEDFDTIAYDCGRCPLFEMGACSDRSTCPHHHNHLWRMRNAARSGRIRDMHRHAHAMLQAIRNTKKEALNAD